MPTTRTQATIQEAHENEKKNVDVTAQEEPEAGQKLDAEEEMDEPPAKRTKMDGESDEKGKNFKPQIGTKMTNPFKIVRKNKFA